VSPADRFLRHHHRRTDEAISQAFARLRSDGRPGGGFDALLGVVRRRAPGLLRAPILQGRHPGVDALEHLARCPERHVRAAPAWEGSTASWRGAVQALSRHLAAPYPVPAFLGSAWYARDDDHGPAQRRWFLEHARGRRFRSLDLPLAMTRRMEHLFLSSPAHLSVPAALRRAELIALGAAPGFADRMVAAATAAGFAHGDFWRTAWRFLIVNADRIPAAQLAPMIDFFQAVRHEPITVDTDCGREQRGPLRPDFSLKGRTVKSVLALMRDWHRDLAGTREVLEWAPSRLQPLTTETWPDDPQEPPITWEIVELTSARALGAETAALEHCVSSYGRLCAAGHMRIWSLRRRRDEAAARSVLTIQVCAGGWSIRQIRGFRNAWPEGEPLRIVRLWAKRERLRILSV
jgi:hypothetical protein